MPESTVKADCLIADRELLLDWLELDRDQKIPFDPLPANVGQAAVRRFQLAQSFLGGRPGKWSWSTKKLGPAEAGQAQAAIVANNQSEAAGGCSNSRPTRKGVSTAKERGNELACG